MSSSPVGNAKAPDSPKPFWICHPKTFGALTRSQRPGMSCPARVMVLTWGNAVTSGFGATASSKGMRLPRRLGLCRHARAYQRLFDGFRQLGEEVGGTEGLRRLLSALPPADVELHRHADG